MCFTLVAKALQDAVWSRGAQLSGFARTTCIYGPRHTEVTHGITVTQKPEFTIGTFEHTAKPLRNAELDANSCWPKAKAAADLGFVVFTHDLLQRR
jgi:hypothetical protein